MTMAVLLARAVKILRRLAKSDADPGLRMDAIALLALIDKESR